MFYFFYMNGHVPQNIIDVIFHVSNYVYFQYFKQKIYKKLNMSLFVINILIFLINIIHNLEFINKMYDFNIA